MKNIIILGSTGSIGLSALKVIESNPDRYRIVALTAGSNLELLINQIEKFKPTAVAISDEKSADILRKKYSLNSGPSVYAGHKGLNYVAATVEADIVISAISGAAGLMPTYSAIQAGKDIALANKETMVMAGQIIMDLAKNKGINILPVDSEHSAILQSLQGHRKEDIKQIILTASGGPFLNFPLERMEAITPDMALKHPNWAMGEKITVDSATLMNKGLEVIEAKWLFSLNMEQISILIHPESIIHSMVEYKDGSIIAQMGVPDMITPISYALSYPEHIETDLPPLRLEQIRTLNFQEPDIKRFKCLDIALKAAAMGRSMPAVLNGANEIAVKYFLKGEIGFLDIPLIIEKTMDKHKVFSISDIEDVIKADIWSRETAEKEIHNLIS